ncbi:MAG: START domain-containing protein [Congregibacter sp.]
MRTKTGLTLLLLLFSLAASAEDKPPETDWRLEKKEDGIEVYTRAVEGAKHRAVKATMVVEAGPAALVALVRDTSACAKWAAFCKSSSEHEVLSETEMYVYTLNDMPWPVKDRDALSHVFWTLDADTGTVVMRATAVTGVMKEKKGTLRLTDAVTSWTFIPEPDERTTVISEAHVNPGGPIPAWITNRLLVDAPFETLSQMRKLISSGRYDDAAFDFMRQ